MTRPVSLNDVLHLDSREDIGFEISEDQWREAVQRSIGQTMLKDGVPVCAAGLMLRWQGNAEAWLMFSSKAELRDIGRARRFIIRFLDVAQSSSFGGRYRRIQATCPTHDNQAARWLESMGFDLEGVAFKYDVLGNDHYLYARVS